MRLRKEPARFCTYCGGSVIDVIVKHGAPWFDKQTGGRYRTIQSARTCDRWWASIPDGTAIRASTTYHHYELVGKQRSEAA